VPKAIRDISRLLAANVSQMPANIVEAFEGLKHDLMKADKDNAAIGES
jgi:hypothetical protein